ncbi:DUF1642 domain-containing protein, partial [Lactococcus cremoris]
MTKFEEEVTRPDNGPITELNNSMHSVLSQYRKMREYADYLEYELKQKDEHILKLENENSFMRDECTTFDSNGMAVEPKLQQQALPVVPECVAGAIAWDEQMDNSIAEILKDIFTANDKDLKEAGLWVKNNPEKYIIARNIGYTVEKPQLFYIDLPKVFGLSDSTFVSKAESGIISEFTKGKDYALKLTEQ